MINRLNVASIYVLDKEEALDFYVNKLGLEVGNDVRQGDYRWLTVRVPGNPDTEVSLAQPGPPPHDEAVSQERIQRPKTRQAVERRGTRRRAGDCPRAQAAVATSPGGRAGRGRT